MKTYTIREVARKLDLSEFYVGKCVREGKLSAYKELVGKSERWTIDEHALEQFEARTRKASNNERKFNVYLTIEQFEDFKKLYPEVRIELANPGKNTQEA